LKRDVAISILPDEFAGDPEHHPIGSSVKRRPTYDVSANSERFLLAPREGPHGGDPANATPITVVLNWTTLLKGK
jgi:hypothetical protein